MAWRMDSWFFGKKQKCGMMKDMRIQRTQALFVGLAVLLVGGAWFGVKAWESRTPSMGAYVPLTPPVMHGIAYTTEEAGLPETYDVSSSDLAYIRGIEERNGRRWITIDRVRYADCRTPRNAGKPLPKGCGKDPVSGAFVIENKDKTTQMFEMATSSGPFFLNVVSDGDDRKQWRTMDVATIQTLLTYTTTSVPVLPEYSFPQLKDETSLFHVSIVKGRVVKVVQKYFE